MTRFSRKYYKMIRHTIPLRHKQDQELLLSYKRQLSEIATELPDITYEELSQELGTPREITDSYLSDQSTDRIMDNLKKTRRIRRWLWFAALVLTIVFAVIATYGVHYYIDLISHTGGYYIEIIH